MSSTSHSRATYLTREDALQLLAVQLSAGGVRFGACRGGHEREHDRDE